MGVCIVLIYMMLISKSIKIKRLKKIVNNSNFFILCNDSSMSVDLYIKLKQSLLKLNLNCCKVNNRLMRVVLKESLLKNYSNSISGSVMLLLGRGEINLKFLVILIELKKYKIDILSVYLNGQLYSEKQLKGIQYLDYMSNIRIFCKSLNNLLKIPCSGFIK